MTITLKDGSQYIVKLPKKRGSKMATSNHSDNTEMKKLYTCHDQPDGFEGIFNERGDLITYWSQNDATWRHEYFEDLMYYLGYTVEHTEKPKFVKLLRSAVKDSYGEDYDYENL